MIWLFANDRYGRVYIQAVRRFARERGCRVRLVVSTRSLQRPRALTRAAAYARWGAKRLPFLIPILVDRRVSLHLVPDVNADDFRACVRDVDHGVICGFDQVFGSDSIHRFATLVNCHPSLLPRYRGPVPSYWVICNRERWSGYTLHEVTERLDDGPILHQQAVPIEAGMTERSLDRAIADAGSEAVVRWMTSRLDGSDWVVATVDVASLVSDGHGYQGRP